MAAVTQCTGTVLSTKRVVYTIAIRILILQKFSVNNFCFNDSPSNLCSRFVQLSLFSSITRPIILNVQHDVWMTRYRALLG